MPHDESHEALHQERERLRVMLTSIGDAVITTDIDGRITFLNPVGESLTGWSNGDAQGVSLDTVFKIVNEETRAKVENPATRALREGIIVGLANHTLLIRKDGTERPIDDSAAPIRDSQGNVAGVVLIFRDVTERREAERALKESEERFRLLVESVKDYAIFVLDPEGRIASWNAGAEHIKGYQSQEIIGKHFSVFYPPEALEIDWPKKELQIATAEGRFEDEGWRVRKDGSRFWANVIITPLRDESGKLKGFAKVTRDLTQRRQMERLRAQAEVLADLDRRKDEFLAMLSHELRNPLSAIVNSVHLLRLRPDDAPLRNDSIAMIERQMTHLIRLIDDLLEVSRITTGRIRLNLEHIDLRTIVERAQEATRETIGRRRQRLTIAVPDQPVWIYADKTRLDQVIMNLLTNASKYNEEGGEITIAVQQESTEAVLRVRDTGIGISPDLLPHVFDLFTQAERSLDRSQGGLGVGLTIVQRLVQMHGGSVAAFSQGMGKGSEFVVRLPLLPPGQLPSAAVSAESPVVKGLRILVVDDNRDAANSTAALLKIDGHHVEVAYSGPAAIRAAKSIQPDTVLLDLGLPGLDGYEVARQLRRDPGLAGLRLIAVSGYGQEADRQRSKGVGFDEHLVKPVDPHKLSAVLASVPR
jgi:PAS domain S-box-containing protein